MDVDHGMILTVETMPISKFKATCLAALQRVNKTGQPLRITRFGKPVADIVPPAPTQVEKRRLGALAGTLEYHGDIVAPTSELVHWEALED